MKEIKYYELVKQIKSSTPNDTPNSNYILDRFEHEIDAQKENERLNKELLNIIRKDPCYYNLNTEYYVRTVVLLLK